MISNELKNSIIQYAFQGKLTTQSEYNIQELIDNIKKEKEDLIQKYKIKKEPVYEDVKDDEVLFEIPKSWKWLRIGELGIYKKGPFGSALTKSIFVEKNIDTVKVYEQQNAIKKDISLGNYYITKDYYEEKMKNFTVETGDIIVSCAGTIGETFIIPQNHELGIINQALMKMTLVDSINKEYFLLYFDYILKKISNKLSSGSAIKNIPPFDIFKQLIIPIPPYEEQILIVEKIKMYTEKLESINKLENELILINQSFPEMFKKSILECAFHGNLVNNSTDINAVDNLLSKIKNTKEKKIKEGILKAEKELKQIMKSDEPYQIPSSWKWIRLGDYCEKITDQVASGSFKSIRDNVPSLKTEDYAIMVKTADFSNDFTTNLTYTTEHAYKFLENSNLFGGELIMSNIGSIGKIFIVPKLNKKMTLAPNTVMLRFTNDELRDYVYYYFQSPTGFSQLMSITSGTAMKKFNKTDLKTLMVPIPPLEEQQRIVSKIQEILPIIEEINTLIIS